MSRKKILIADDEIIILNSLKRMLEDTYDVTLAVSGIQTLEKINEQADGQFDLILVDVWIPDINGVDLYHTIAKLHPGLEKKILFMTGGPLEVYLDEFFKQIDNPQLAKPFECDKLRQVIENFLSLS